ncbi:MAG: hypothetical protein H0U70_11975 [Tatlockia sp.]|nr:hypothetical protein [Tatlockia sp.]
MNKSLKILNKWVIAGLIALVSSQYAFADSLVGRWQHGRQATSISMGRDFKLQFCNEQGNCAEGFYRGKNFVFVPQWNVTGSINRRSNLIAWSNGTEWIRSNMPPQNEVVVHIGRISVSGPWLHDGKPASIQMQGDGIHFTLVNEFGQPSHGHINGRGDLVLPQIKVTGRLHKHNRVITWSNGTSWYRP